jgi:hypothetical protein
MQRRNYGCRDLHHEPADNRVSDGNFVNVPPLQLSEEGIWVHSARLDEALVTAALYLGAGNLKSTCNAQDKQRPSSAVIVRLAESPDVDRHFSGARSTHAKLTTCVFRIAGDCVIQGLYCRWRTGVRIESLMAICRKTPKQGSRRASKTTRQNMFDIGARSD